MLHSVLQDTSLLHLGLARLTLPGGMRDRERAPPACQDPYLAFVFVLQPEGRKKTKTPTTLSIPADDGFVP